MIANNATQQKQCPGAAVGSHGLAVKSAEVRSLIDSFLRDGGQHGGV